MANLVVTDFFGYPETLVDMGNGTYARLIVTAPPGSVTGAGMATGQVSVGTSSTLICAARAGRLSVTIVNLGVNDLYLGNTGVTTATGLLLVGIKGSAITIESTLAIYGVGAVAQSVSYMENY